MSNTNALLYVYGVFDTGNPSSWPAVPGYISDILASDFNVVVFSTFHVDALGNLFGSVPLVTDGQFNPTNQLDPDLPQYYQQLAQAGRTLYYSIGNSAGTAGDMANLALILADPTGAAYANLQANLKVLAEVLTIAGIDFDFEPADYGSTEQTIVTDFTTFCTGLKLQVTYCPYAVESWWIDAQIAAVQAGGAVQWWNLQCYAGGFGNSPATWLPSIQQNAGALGVADPPTFIVPGVDTSGGPAAVQAEIQSFASGAPGLNAAFLWQLGDIENQGGATVAQYATAVLQGLSG